MITPKEAKSAIGRYWGDGNNLSRSSYVDLDARLPKSDLPILDRLLSACDLLDEYNRRNRPAFAAFRNWWMAVTWNDFNS
jgi:hypothetical protein